MSKRFRLTLPEKEAETLIEQAKAEGFKTPQQLILDRLRRWDEIQAKYSKAEKKHQKALTHLQDIDAQVQKIAETKTHEVLEVIKVCRHELLMLYAFQCIFPKVPANVAKVIEKNNLTPGVFYMKHVCLNFPKYLEQIQNLTQQLAQSSINKTAMEQQFETEKAQLQEQRNAAQTLKAALQRVLRDNESLEELCQKLHIRLLGHTDFEAAMTYMMEKGGSSRHQDYVSRALRAYQVSKVEDLEGQLQSAETQIAEQASQLLELQHARDFYKNKSWWQKLWETLGRGTLPPKFPTTSTDDDIPF